MNLYKKILPILIITGFILPQISFAIYASETIDSPTIELPSTLEEAAQKANNSSGMVTETISDNVKSTINNEVLPFWKRIWTWVNDHIFSSIFNWIKQIVKPKVKEEIENRKPAVKEEFKKETNEVKEELPEISTSLWKKFKDLIK